MPEGKRSLGRYRHRWEDSIKLILEKKGCGGMELINLDQDRGQRQALVYMVMNLQVP
jgi:hypothetical protein